VDSKDKIGNKYFIYFSWWSWEQYWLCKLHKKWLNC